MSALSKKPPAQALQLSNDEKADLAARLIDSLDSRSDRDADEAWAAEITRRMGVLDAGAQPIP